MRGRHAGRQRQAIDWRWPGAIFLVALAVRLIALFQSRHDPFFAHPIIDSATYDRMAWDYARGWPLWNAAAGREAGRGGDIWIWQPPLYPWLLGLFYRAAGHTLVGARVVQAAIGAGACVLLYAIGLRTFDRRVARGAALTMAVYGPLVYFDGEILPPSVYVALLLAALLATLVADAHGGKRWWGIAGAFFGLAAVARPDILAFLPFVLLWMLWGRRAEWPSRARAIAGGMPPGGRDLADRNHRPIETGMCLTTGCRSRPMAASISISATIPRPIAPWRSVRVSTGTGSSTSPF